MRRTQNSTPSSREDSSHSPTEDINNTPPPLSRTTARPEFGSAFWAPHTPNTRCGASPLSPLSAEEDTPRIAAMSARQGPFQAIDFPLARVFEERALVPPPPHDRFGPPGRAAPDLSNGWGAPFGGGLGLPRHPARAHEEAAITPLSEDAPPPRVGGHTSPRRDVFVTEIFSPPCAAPSSQRYESPRLSLRGLDRGPDMCIRRTNTVGDGALRPVMRFLKEATENMRVTPPEVVRHFMGVGSQNPRFVTAQERIVFGWLERDHPDIFAAVPSELLTSHARARQTRLREQEVAQLIMQVGTELAKHLNGRPGTPSKAEPPYFFQP
eukprot:gnl/Chilomastix_cuspidata/7825.p1 GENE.gnl/Chilomastix_cuspidata/7825~~gnl/Chilomastix_cuspidata/7825.p1  ORF type:complete len:370 (+),score=19.21 gnl/Chilomastix_cuspidata/7825:141-1112(+)